MAERAQAGSKVLAALREVHDGRFSRHNDGRRVSWEGRVSVLAAVTEAIDELGMGPFGERFLSYRIPHLSADGDLAAGRFALRGSRASRSEVRELATEFLSRIRIPEEVPDLSYGDIGILALLGTFVTPTRSAVMWDSRHDGVADVPQPERSPRLLRGLGQLLRAFRGNGRKRDGCVAGRSPGGVGQHPHP